VTSRAADAALAAGAAVKVGVTGTALAASSSGGAAESSPHSRARAEQHPKCRPRRYPVAAGAADNASDVDRLTQPPGDRLHGHRQPTAKSSLPLPADTADSIVARV